MPRPIDLSGKRFGRVTAIRRDGRRGSASMWLCRCDCGTEWSVNGAYLRGGDTKSCGCGKLEKLIARSTTHGRARTTEHRIWCAIKSRCHNPNTTNYHLYGGRGIRVDETWRRDFTAFLADVGPRPGPEYSIDRIDNNGHYAPGNCRWATRKEQNNNRRPRSCRSYKELRT